MLHKFVNQAIISGTNESNHLLEHLKNPLIAGVPKALSSVILDFKQSFEPPFDPADNLLKRRKRRETDNKVTNFERLDNRWQ